AALADREATLSAREEAFETAQRLMHEAQVREATARIDLTQALTEALVGRAELAARLRVQAVRAYFGGTDRGLPRRRNRISRRVDAVLGRLTSVGRALVIARAGAWRPSGRWLFDLRHMAAYVRRGADPSVQPPVPFEQAWYLLTYADVAASGRAPLLHYLLAGAAEGRTPHRLFDPAWYRRENAQILAASGQSPFEHFASRGAAEGRNPHPLFDMAHYASQAPELAPGEDMLSHYMREGWTRDLSPHPLFDPAWYRRQAPGDAADVPPLNHYVLEGWRAGLSPHPLFDVSWYLERNPDVVEAGTEPLAHFMDVGAAEGRSPGPWFDLAHYVSARGAALAAGTNPLVDYLQGGAWAVTEPRPGFPSAAYLAAYPGLVGEGLTPLEHWARRSAG
ncbi:MAG: hypothetical protein JWQ52_2513, partial [Phenylobacterium sp.]|nr:hypothetical protein [Phenylobacterium sp.]